MSESANVFEYQGQWYVVYSGGTEASFASRELALADARRNTDDIREAQPVGWAPEGGGLGPKLSP